MADMRRFEGMGAVVTGGASGIGFGVAKRILAEGGKVMLWDIDQGRLDAAKDKLGAGAHVDRFDLADADAVEARPRAPKRRSAMSTCSSAAPA